MPEPSARLEEYAQCLQRLPVFAALQPEDLAALAAIAVVQEVPAGRRLWAQGSPGDRIVLVLGGHLQATRLDSQGREQAVARFGPGDAFGETSLLLGQPHDVTVTALSPVRLLVIPRPEFMALMGKRRSLARSLQPREDICRAVEAPSFPWLEPQETVVLVVRRHSWALWQRLILPFLLLAGLTVAAWYLDLAPVLLVVPPLLALVYAAWQWLEWHNDALVVTSQRLAHVEKRILVYERQEQAPLDKIQDVTVLRSGLAAALFGTGTITAETAGATGQIVFTWVPRPNDVKDVIFAQVERYRAMQRATRRQTIESELRRQLGLTNVDGGGQDPDAKPRVQPSGPVDGLAVNITRLMNSALPRLRQQQGETILWRKHWLVLLRALAWPTLAAAALALLPLLTHVRLSLPLAGGTAGLVLAWFWWQWENWRNDVYILTPDRIIDIKQVPLRLRSERREGNLLNIQNVTYVVPSFLAGLLKYGDVTIETAGQVGNFTFESVYMPANVQADIFRYVEANRGRQREAADAEQQQALADMLAAYERLRSEIGQKGRG